MFQYLDRNIGLRTLILSFPVVFLVHDSEEVLTAERFWRENRDSLPIPAAIKNRIEITTEQMAWAVLCVFAIVLSASCLATKTPVKRGRTLGFYNAAAGTLFMTGNTLPGSLPLLAYPYLTLPTPFTGYARRG